MSLLAKLQQEVCEIHNRNAKFQYVIRLLTLLNTVGNIINMAYTDLKSCPLIRIKKWGKGKDVIVHISNKHIDISTYMHIITHTE